MLVEVVTKLSNDVDIYGTIDTSNMLTYIKALTSIQCSAWVKYKEVRFSNDKQQINLSVSLTGVNRAYLWFSVYDNANLDNLTDDVIKAFVGVYNYIKDRTTGAKKYHDVCEYHEEVVTRNSNDEEVRTTTNKKTSSWQYNLNAKMYELVLRCDNGDSRGIAECDDYIYENLNDENVAARIVYSGYAHYLYIAQYPDNETLNKLIDFFKSTLS